MRVPWDSPIGHGGRMRPIRVVIAADYTMLREGIRRLLASDADLEIIAEAADGSQMQEAVEKFKPDILLLDSSLLRGLEALALIRNNSPTTRTLILTEDPPEKGLLGYLRAGARGVFSKSETGAILAKAIRVVAADEIWAGRKVLTRVIQELSARAVRDERLRGLLTSRLTPRELRIAELVARGRNNREIAEKLRLSEKTVKNHLSNIYQKFGLRNRTHLATLLLRGRRVWR